MIHYITLLTSKALSVFFTISVAVSKLSFQMRGSTYSYVLPCHYDDHCYDEHKCARKHKCECEHKCEHKCEQKQWPINWIPPKHLRIDTYSYPDEQKSQDEDTSPV